MATDLKDYIKTYDSVFSRDFCDATIEAFSKSDSEYIDRGQQPAFTHLNISKKYMKQDPLWMGIQAQMSQTVAQTIEKYVNELDVGPDMPRSYGFEEFRMKKYENNGYDQFKDHVDVGDYGSAIRFMVIFIYLNDVEEGGETVFPKLDLKIKPECGKVLIFPPHWQYRHAGLPPVSNDKYIAGTYLHYSTQGMTVSV